MSFRSPHACPTSSPPTSPKHRRASLADDITVVGGNRTGIFVSHVRPGSPAEQCGLKEGSELLEVCVVNAPFKVLSADPFEGGHAVFLLLLFSWSGFCSAVGV